MYIYAIYIYAILVNTPWSIWDIYAASSKGMRWDETEQQDHNELG